MVSKIAIVSVPMQRELVKMLFYWEEELVRWRLLCEEEGRLRTALVQLSGDSNEYVNVQEAMRVVQAKKRVRPSLRDENGHSAAVEDLPKYARYERQL